MQRIYFIQKRKDYEMLDILVKNTPNESSKILAKLDAHVWAERTYRDWDNTAFLYEAEIDEELLQKYYKNERNISLVDMVKQRRFGIEYELFGTYAGFREPLVREYDGGCMILHGEWDFACRLPTGLETIGGWMPLFTNRLLPKEVLAMYGRERSSKK